MVCAIETCCWNLLTELNFQFGTNYDDLVFRIAFLDRWRYRLAGRKPKVDIELATLLDWGVYGCYGWPLHDWPDEETRLLTGFITATVPFPCVDSVGRFVKPIPGGQEENEDATHLLEDGFTESPDLLLPYHSEEACRVAATIETMLRVNEDANFKRLLYLLTEPR